MCNLCSGWCIMWVTVYIDTHMQCWRNLVKASTILYQKTLALECTQQYSTSSSCRALHVDEGPLIGSPNNANLTHIIRALGTPYSQYSAYGILCFPMPSIWMCNPYTFSFVNMQDVIQSSQSHMCLADVLCKLSEHSCTQGCKLNNDHRQRPVGAFVHNF